MTTDIPTPYNVNNYFNETEKCSEWEEYLPAGCKERRRGGGSLRDGGWELAHEQRTEKVLSDAGSKM